MLRFSKKKLCFIFWTILTISYMFYAELFVYHINSGKWPQMECQNKSNCLRILLAADPQIIGNLNEVFHPITPFSQLDSDRYLKITYRYAYNYVKPHVVLFLGDLMDEAHIASDIDFSSYVQRISDIFLRPYENDVRYIWLPGDNDIGGEDTKVTPKRLQRFERAFSQSSIHNMGSVTFFKINRLTGLIPVYKRERDFYDISRIFVGLSHVPLLFRPSIFTEKVINKMLPHLLFTAHEHKSMIISTDALLRKDRHITPITPENKDIYLLALGVQNMYEILIPTCSYRMGTNKIGFGYAVIENNNELKFTILWSPSRFERLVIYLVFFLGPLGFILTYRTCCFFKTVFRRIKRLFYLGFLIAYLNCFKLVM